MRTFLYVGVASTLAVLTAGAIFGLSAQSRADEIQRRLSFVDMNGQPHKFDQSAAEGFIKIWGLPVETAARKAPAGVGIKQVEPVSK